MANTKIVSPSGLDRFNSCPLKFTKDEFNSKGEQTVAQVMGKENHRILEQCFKGEIKNNDDLSRAEKMLTHDFLTQLGLFTAEDTQEFVEDTFFIKYGEYALHGVKDLVHRVDDRALVIDWKTGKTFFRQKDIDESIQGKIYALDEFKNNENCNIVFFKIAMTEYQSVVSSTYYRDDLVALETEIDMAVRNYINAHKYNIFPARPSTYCGRCEHLQDCPYNIFTSNKTRLKDVKIDDEFAEAIKQIEVTTAYLKTLQGICDNYAFQKAGSDDFVNIADINVKINNKVTERVSTSKKAKEVLEHYKDKLGIKIDTSISKIRELPEEDIAKLREIGIITSSVKQDLKYSVNKQEISDEN
jgi:hypothetical protein